MFRIRLVNLERGQAACQHGFGDSHSHRGFSPVVALGFSGTEPFERFRLFAGRKPLKRLLNSEPTMGTGLKPRYE
jgi:hypothetical protein